MAPNESPPSTERESEAVALELYKTAFARLNFQDDYLFKFSTVFLTAHGALAVFAGSAFFRTNSPNYPALLVVSAIGLLLAVVWCLWIRHNDYWHSVWTGALRNIELTHLKTKVRVFALEHDAIAKQGNRTGRFLPSGHTIAQLVPLGIAIAWAWSLYAAW